MNRQHLTIIFFILCSVYVMINAAAVTAKDGKNEEKDKKEDELVLSVQPLEVPATPPPPRYPDKSPLNRRLHKYRVTGQLNALKETITGIGDSIQCAINNLLANNNCN